MGQRAWIVGVVGVFVLCAALMIVVQAGGIGSEVAAAQGHCPPGEPCAPPAAPPTQRVRQPNQQVAPRVTPPTATPAARVTDAPTEVPEAEVRVTATPESRMAVATATPVRSITPTPIPPTTTAPLLNPMPLPGPGDPGMVPPGELAPSAQVPAVSRPGMVVEFSPILQRYIGELLDGDPFVELVPGESGKYPSLALDGAGNPIVSYVKNTGELRVVRCVTPTCTGETTVTTVYLETSPNAIRTSLRLDASGNPAITSGNVLVRCGNPECSAGNVVTVWEEPDVPRVTSLALSAAGNPIIAYDRLFASSWKVAILFCGNPTCTSDNVVVTPGSLDEVGNQPALVLDGSGQPVVSYFGPANPDFRLLRCGNPTCTANNSIAVVDQSPDVANYFSSLVLDGSGNPAIAYTTNNSGLRVARCGNPTCTSGNSYAAPQQTVASGRYPSLALDAAGNPVVSSLWSAFQASRLVVLHCADSACADGNSLATPGYEQVGEIPAEHTALALDAAGNPVIMFQVGTAQGPIKLLRCTNPNC